MTALATDNFNRANVGPPLDGNWAKSTGWGNWYKIVSSTAQPETFAGDCAQYNNAVTWPNDQYAQATITVSGSAGDSGLGIAIRLSASAQTAYWAVTGADGVLTLGMFSGGSFTEISTFSSGAWVNGDTLYIEAQGTNLVVKRNGVAKITTTDGTIASGNAGILYSSTITSGSEDLWEGGDFSGGSTTTISPPVGAIIYGGLNPALQFQLAPSDGTDIYSGQTPSLSQSFLLAPTDGATIFGGLIPNLTFQIASQIGVISWDGNIPSLSQTGGTILHFSRRHGRVYYN